MPFPCLFGHATPFSTAIPRLHGDGVAVTITSRRSDVAGADCLCNLGPFRMLVSELRTAPNCFQTVSFWVAFSHYFTSRDQLGARRAITPAAAPGGHQGGGGRPKSLRVQ